MPVVQIWKALLLTMQLMVMFVPNPRFCGSVSAPLLVTGS